MSKRIKIAIDGPAAAGKSTIAKKVGFKLGYTYIDTGAMYRALTYKASASNIDMEDGDKLSELLDRIEILLVPSSEGQSVIVDGEDITNAIRSKSVTNNVSAVAKHAKVRRLMVQKQRDLTTLVNGVVMDGRDIGTTVLPDAELKIFMTASVQERAKRRYTEDEARGITTSLEQLEKEISDRDRADSERIESPLRQADDAIYIDTTSKTIEEVADEISKLAEGRLGE